MIMKYTSKDYLLLVFFIIICYAVSFAGAVFAPGPWYDTMNQAPWTPPTIVFPIVWGILYFMIAVVGWLIFNSPYSKLKLLWIIQLTLNASWSWIFFGQRWVLLGLIDIAVLTFVVAALMLSCWRLQLKVPAFLLIPYLIWLCIATSLNAYFFIAN